MFLFLGYMVPNHPSIIYIDPVLTHPIHPKKELIDQSILEGHLYYLLMDSSLQYTFTWIVLFEFLKLKKSFMIHCILFKTADPEIIKLSLNWIKKI